MPVRRTGRRNVPTADVTYEGLSNGKTGGLNEAEAATALSLTGWILRPRLVMSRSKAKKPPYS
jgi:hypothetical protein